MKPHNDAEQLSLGYFFPAGKTNHLYSDKAAQSVPEMTKANLVELAQAAESVGFDSLFIADNWSGHQRAAEAGGHQSPAYHAPLLAMALLTATDRIGVISTFHTTHHKPAHVARMGATLDAFGDGRWGWNIVTGFSSHEAELFGESFIDHDVRYDMADEFTDIVKMLWDEHEPIDFHGMYYKAKGRIKLPRPTQRPHPFLVSAGSSGAGVAFAAKHCDQLVILAGDEARVNQIDAALQEQTSRTGRAVGLSPFGMAIVRDGDGEAEEILDDLKQSINIEATREISADVLGSIESSRAMYEKMGEEEATLAFGGAGHLMNLVGTPEQVAERLISLKTNTNTSSILINFPLWSPAELRGFEKVLPYLREAGVWSPPAERNWSW